MSRAIDIIGIGADGPAGLRPALRDRVEAADFLAGGERHLGYFPAARGERWIIRDNLPTLAEQLRCRGEQHCVVLASGDPLFYGVGRYLVEALGPDQCRVEPAVSSMQLAFARAGLSWQDAALGSVHGRDLRAAVLPLLGQPLIGLFTQDGRSPAAVAQFFARFGLCGYEARVAENLGAADERLSPWLTLDRLADMRFGPLNYLILRQARSIIPRGEVRRRRALVPGVPDTEFARPEDAPEVMTRQEVRSVVLAKLCVPTEPDDTAWDIGAGLGTVAIELAVLRPHLEVVAVERDAGRRSLLEANRDRFGAYNVRVIEATAPEALATETEPPRLVFVGGSGGHLEELLDFVATRLLPSGRLVATFVTLEHLAAALERLRGWAWPHEVAEIHVARSDALAGLTGLKPQRGVFIVSADKPPPDGA